MSKVYAAINAVQKRLSETGIAKARQASGGGANYAFRGIDDVYAALSPLLAEYGLCIIPRMVERDAVERKSGAGKPLFYVTLKAEFDFVAVEDGSVHTAVTYGEAMDSSDKATNKAMSAAYKYAAFLTFAIPTEGDNDADATGHDVAPVETIDDTQRAHLTGLIGATNTDVAGLCKHYKIDKLPDLPAAAFEQVRALLEKRLPSAEQKEAA